MIRKQLYIPGHLLEHAAGLVGDFFVHAALLGWIDFALAVFLFDGVEAWMRVDLAKARRGRHEEREGEKR